MEIILDIKCNLKTHSILEILSESVYMPNEEKLNKIADRYINNYNIVVYGYYLQNTIYGLIVLDITSKEDIIILNISVSKNKQNFGIGSKLIDFVINSLEPKTLTAETDDDAVGFYLKYGFNISNLGEKYSDTIRYECRYVC